MQVRPLVNSILGFCLLSSLVGSSCSDRAREPPPAIILDEYGNILSVEEAEEILGFAIALPAKTPEGIINKPQVTLERGLDGAELVAIYLEDARSNNPIRARIRLSNSEYVLPEENLSQERMLKGRSVFIQVHRTAAEAELFAVSWDGSTGLLLEMLWLAPKDGMYSEEQLTSACILLLESIQEIRGSPER